MQLTPRNLVMACGAMLAGGAVFGVITTLMPAVSLPTATAVNPTAMPTASTATSGDLGDEEITFPASPVASPVPWPTPIATSPIPTATVPTPSPSPAASSPSPSRTLTTSTSPVAPSTSTTPRPRTTPRPGAGQSVRVSRAPRPTATPTATRRPAPAPAPARAPRRAAVTGGWQAPSLHVGANTIALPRLTSKATVRVTVGCSPSSACHLDGDQLVIDPAATAVTVTWWAPATAGYRSWQVSRVL